MTVRNGPSAIRPPIHAMTVDVEDYFHVAALKDVVDIDNWDAMPSRVVKNTHGLMELFDIHQIKGTFFILGWVAEKHPELVKDITKAGHEVASHGYSHQLIYSQTPEVFREETKRSKAILEDLSGKSVDGYRAASYSITRKSLWALNILAELGFTWDSSIFPVYHDNYGIPETPTSIYTIKTQHGELTEVPITSAKWMGMNVPAAGGGYFRQFPYPMFKYFFQRASLNNTESKLFYIHPWEIDPGQPKFDNASFFSRFRHYTNLDKCYSRLERLVDDFEFSTITDCVLHGKTDLKYHIVDDNLIPMVKEA